MSRNAPSDFPTPPNPFPLGLTWLILLLGLLWLGGITARALTWLAANPSPPPRKPLDSSVRLPPPSPRFRTVAAVPAGDFRYGGSNAWAAIRLRIDAQIQGERPEFRFQYIEPETAPAGSSSGIQQLLDRQITFAQTARPLTRAEQEQARARGMALIEIPVALEGIAIAVHPDLDLAPNGIRLEQLHDIYTGKLQNWAELGGPDLPILPISSVPETGGGFDSLPPQLAQDQEWGATVQFVSPPTLALRELEKTQGSIYFGSAAQIIPQCLVKPLPIQTQNHGLVAPYQSPIVSPENCPQQRNRINTQAFATGTYPLSHYLYVVINQNGGVEEQAGRAYAALLLSRQGQTLLGQLGYAPIRQ